VKKKSARNIPLETMSNKIVWSGIHERNLPRRNSGTRAAVRVNRRHLHNHSSNQIISLN